MTAWTLSVSPIAGHDDLRVPNYAVLSREHFRERERIKGEGPLPGHRSSCPLPNPLPSPEMATGEGIGSYSLGQPCSALFTAVTRQATLTRPLHAAAGQEASAA